MGRLHRHVRSRPAGYATAQCWVLAPPDDLIHGLDDRGHVVSAYQKLGYGSVYHDVGMIELTRRLLIASPVLHLPDDNRRLVEGATHPEALAALTDPRWQTHRQEIQGGDLAQAVMADQARVPFDQLFGEITFPDDETITTRLDLHSRHVAVQPPFRSPLGRPVASLVIPGRWLTASPHSVTPAEARVAQTGPDGTVIQYDGNRYCYDRYGLRPETPQKGGTA
jgi:CRISPR-associated endonuclease/helicase Cas3